MSDQPDDRDESLIGELMGEHRDLPAEGEAMFEVEEIATANTVLRGARSMIEDRLGEDVARPLGTVLLWAQSILLTAVLDDDNEDAGTLSRAAELFRKRLGDDDEGSLEGLPYGSALRA